MVTIAHTFVSSKHTRPRLLLLTPDYPPAPGGIQVVAERLVEGLERFDTRTVALGGAGAHEYDATRAAQVRRVGAGPVPHSGRVALLNAVALGEALRFRPDVVLSMHLVASPAAAAVKRTFGTPVAQYFHAEEIGARPRLAAFAAEQADAVIAVSAYTAELRRGAHRGARGDHGHSQRGRSCARGARRTVRAPDIRDGRSAAGALQGPRRAGARAGARAGEGPAGPVGGHR